jgi:hypothetical protein
MRLLIGTGTPQTTSKQIYAGQLIKKTARTLDDMEECRVARNITYLSSLNNKFQKYEICWPLAFLNKKSQTISEFLVLAFSALRTDAVMDGYYLDA